MSHLLSPPVVGRKFSVWFTQGFSSQYDLLAAVKKSSLQPYLTTIASHRQCRDEILSMADLALIEPTVGYPHFVLAEAVKHKAQLVITSHGHDKYEELRPLFEQHGIMLLTGTRGQQNHHYLDNKFEFTQMCQIAGIPVVDAIQVESTSQLVEAIQAIQARQLSVCVKPVTGVFAQGFWQLSDDFDYFHALFNPTSYQANSQQFIEAYDQQSVKRPYLVMPFLSGDECSVDMFCVTGDVKVAVTRIKKPHWQEVLPIGPCDQIVRQLARLFMLDGIVNAQFRQDNAGKWYVLEINARPSGGIGMTLHSQVNLVAECIAYHAQLPLLRTSPRPALVRQLSQSVEVQPMQHYSVERIHA